MRRVKEEVESSGALLETTEQAMDVEAAVSTSTSIVAISNSPSSVAGMIWLALWFLNNILVTLLNKWSFANVSFPYPYAVSAFSILTLMYTHAHHIISIFSRLSSLKCVIQLSAVHMACNGAGAYLYFIFDHDARNKRKALNASKLWIIVGFRLIFNLFRFV